MRIRSETSAGGAPKRHLLRIHLATWDLRLDGGCEIALASWLGPDQLLLRAGGGRCHFLRARRSVRSTPLAGRFRVGKREPRLPSSRYESCRLKNRLAQFRRAALGSPAQAPHQLLRAKECNLVLPPRSSPSSLAQQRGPSFDEPKVASSRPVEQLQEPVERPRPAAPVPSVAPSPAKVSTGTGFFVHRNGSFVTNAHVVKDCSAVHGRTDDRNLASARIVGTDSANDLALLRVEASPKFSWPRGGTSLSGISLPHLAWATTAVFTKCLLRFRAATREDPCWISEEV